MRSVFLALGFVSVAAYGQAGSGLRPYLDCYSVLTMASVGNDLNVTPDSSVFVVPGKVPVKDAGMKKGIYVFTHGKTYAQALPAPKDGIVSAEFTLRPETDDGSSKLVTFRYSHDEKAGSPEVEKLKNPSNLETFVDLEKGSLASEKDAVKVLRTELAARISTVHTHYETERQLVDRDVLQNHLSALKICEDAADPALNAAIKKERKRFGSAAEPAQVAGEGEKAPPARKASKKAAR